METIIRPKSETKKSRINKIVLNDTTKEYIAYLKNEIKKTRKSYPLSFKKKVIALTQMENVNYSLIQRELGVSRKSIYTWVSQAERLGKETDEKRKRLRGAGRKPNFGDRITHPFGSDMSMEESFLCEKEQNFNIGNELIISEIHHQNNNNVQNEEHQIINSDEINTSTNTQNNNSIELINSTKNFESLSGSFLSDEEKEKLEEKKLIEKNEWDDDDKISYYSKLLIKEYKKFI